MVYYFFISWAWRKVYLILYKKKYIITSNRGGYVMKGTYDNHSISFQIVFHAKHGEDMWSVDFDKLYGTSVNVDEVCAWFNCSMRESFILKGTQLLQIDEKQTTTLINLFTISYDEELTIEDTIQKYFEKNFTNFTNPYRVCALAFLQRYCVDYNEIELSEDKKTLKLIKNKK